MTESGDLRLLALLVHHGLLARAQVQTALGTADAMTHVRQMCGGLARQCDRTCTTPVTRVPRPQVRNVG